MTARRQPRRSGAKPKSKTMTRTTSASRATAVAEAEESVLVETAGPSLAPAGVLQAQPDEPKTASVDPEGLVTAARAEADQLLTGSQAEAEALLAAAREQVADAEAAIATARAEAATVTKAATAEAETILARAKAQAERMRRLTDEQIAAAEDTVQRARTIADGDLQAVEQSLARRREAAARIQREAETEADRIVEAARVRAEEIRAEAEQDKARLQAEADHAAEYAAHLIQEAKQRAADLVTAAEDDARARREAAAEMRRQAEHDAEQLRSQAREEVTTAEEDAARILDTARGQAAGVVSDAEDEAERLRDQAQQTLQAAQEQAEEDVLKVRSLAEAKAAGVISQAEAAAADRLTAAEQEAARRVAAAEQHARMVRDRCAAEQRQAQQVLAETHEEVAAARALIDRQEKRKNVVNCWGPRVALGATIVLTASGEFALAQLSGWPAAVAWALPLAIDVYVVQAFRRHRDVAGALILMVAANAIYHLGNAGLVGVDKKGHPLWWLIVGVAAIAPWVMWRIHQITKEPDEGNSGETATGSGTGPDETPGTPPADETSSAPASGLTGPGETGGQRPAAPSITAETSEGETHRALETRPTETDDLVSTTETASHYRETSRSDTVSSSAEHGVTPVVLRSAETGRPALPRDAEIEGQITSLLSLMYRRQGADTVSVDEAKAVLGVSRATAGRRLEIARSRFTKVS